MSRIEKVKLRKISTSEGRYSSIDRSADAGRRVEDKGLVRLLGKQLRGTVMLGRDNDGLKLLLSVDIGCRKCVDHFGL